MATTVSEVKDAKLATLKMAALSTEVKNSALKAMAEAVRENKERILAANAEDVSESENSIPPELLKRLRLNDDKVNDMIASILDVARISDPVGETMSAIELDEGLELYQKRCPIGLIGVIFEARPEVVPQIMSLCLKSGNAIIFKGGSEAKRSNRILFDILREAAASAGVPAEAFVLMETREDITEILKMDEYIDLLIPRGSYGFVKYIQSNTHIPVLGHSAGICHIYVDSEADLLKAFGVVLDSKIQYPAACNAVEKVLVNESIVPYFLPRMADQFAANGVEMRVEKGLEKYLIGFDYKIATEDDWTAEYDGLVIAIRSVKDMDEAIAMINTNGSHHTDAIITENREKQDEFARRVDSADIFINASTRFADGFRFGKGAEVGISTNKIHARGPMGMEGLMIYKYVLVGNGQMVKDYAGKDAKPYTHRPIDVSKR
ncbi:MAG: glutamate-5-semialdehyde dehydrogenase [Candidatus Methanomethylophilus sp.]|nr:glutamate-5-semialdehyde dehydrogenase [Methanomethylophilus sp.]